MQTDMVKTMFPIFLKALREQYFVGDKDQLEAFIVDLTSKSFDVVIKVFRELIEEAKTEAGGEQEALNGIQNVELFVNVVEKGAVPNLKANFGALVSQKLSSHALKDPAPAKTV